MKREVLERWPLFVVFFLPAIVKEGRGFIEMPPDNKRRTVWHGQLLD